MGSDQTLGTYGGHHLPTDRGLITFNDSNQLRVQSMVYNFLGKLAEVVVIRNN